MPNANYLRGRKFEWQVKKDLEGQGYHVIRASGSHGVFDLVAIGPGYSIRLIQCKVTKTPTAAMIKKLKQELKQTTPITSIAVSDGCQEPCFHPHDTVTIDVELAVKTHGESAYKIYGV
jgi:hypothetical protein